MYKFRAYGTLRLSNNFSFLVLQLQVHYLTGFFGRRRSRGYNVKGWSFLICFLRYLLTLYILVLPSHCHFLSSRRHFSWHLSPILICVRDKAFIPYAAFSMTKGQNHREREEKERKSNKRNYFNTVPSWLCVINM